MRRLANQVRDRAERSFGEFGISWVPVLDVGYLEDAPAHLAIATNVRDQIVAEVFYRVW